MTVAYVQVNGVQRFMLSVQLARYVGLHHEMTDDQRHNLADELILRYSDGLRFGRALLS